MDASTACAESQETPAPGDMGRRGFLFAAGVATVGVWVAPSIVSLSPALAVTSPGPDENDEGGDNGEVGDEQPDDIEVIDRAVTREPTGETPTGGTPTGGTSGRDEVEVLGVTLTGGESSLPRTGADRDALLGAGAAAMVAGATLLRANRNEDVAVGDIDPSGESDPS